MEDTQCHCYLFEVKSIQGYLFHSGKLKDVISASERLDLLIDSGVDEIGQPIRSVLSDVLEKANLSSDIHVSFSNTSSEANQYSQSITENKVQIRFLRCKGGAFYCFSEEREAIQQLRSLWTLTISLLFPSLEYTDAFTSSASLSGAIDEAFKLLSASRNSPQVKLPISMTTFERYQRTGKCAIPLTPLAERARHEEELDDNSLDIDVERHRQAYQSLNMRSKAALQNKFTPQGIDVSYPIDFEKQFDFQSPLKALTNQQKEAVKDIALIHIDGNGMGLLLMALKEQLSKLSNEDYQRGFRTFSDALSRATIQAAKAATKQLYDIVTTEQALASSEKSELPMRPIVLGGDDITLYCRADLALQYSETFCTEFKKHSKAELQPIFDEFLNSELLHPYITASGGILYHKASHPFTQSHKLVELLADKAKQLTKSIYGLENKSKVGPAALAFYRVSNSTQTSFTDLIENAHVHKMRTGETFRLSQSAYFVEDDNITSQQSLTTIKKLLGQSDFSVNRWKKIATFLAQGDLPEAKRIFARAKQLNEKDKRSETSLVTLQELSKGHECTDFYWITEESNRAPTYQTVISDLLILDNYRSVISAGEEDPDA